MSDQVESALNDEDEAGSSQDQPISPKQEASPTSPELTEAQVDAVLGSPKGEAIIQRHLDKRFSKLEKRVDELSQLDRYEQLRDEGMTPKQAKQQLEMEDNLNWLKEIRGGAGAVASEATEPAADVSASSLNYNKALQAQGLDPASLTGQQAMDFAKQAEGITSQDELDNLAFKFKAGMLAESQPAESAKASMPTTPIATDGSKEAIQAQIDNELENMTKDSPAKLRELAKQLEKLE